MCATIYEASLGAGREGASSKVPANCNEKRTGITSV